MGTLYAAYRKNKLAGGGSMYSNLYAETSSMDIEVPPIIGGGSRSYPAVSGGSSNGTATGAKALGDQKPIGTSGGRTGKVNWGQVGASGSALINEVIDANGKGDPLTGRKSVGSSIAKGAVSGAAAGTSILPGWGTLIGAVVGAGAGWITGGSKRRKARKEMNNEIAANRTEAINYSSALAARDPTSYAGNSGADYYGKYGGKMTKFGMRGTTEFSAPLARMYMYGGRAKSLSSDNAEMVGKSHSKGGINIPGMNAEVEGGETTVGDYVFSKKLGFADIHKPIARAKGKIEAKPPTPERVNSLRRLKEEEGSMAMAQDYFRNKLKTIKGA